MCHFHILKLIVINFFYFNMMKKNNKNLIVYRYTYIFMNINKMLPDLWKIFRMASYNRSNGVVNSSMTSLPQIQSHPRY